MLAAGVAGPWVHARRVQIENAVQQRIAGLVDGGRGGVAILASPVPPRSRPGMSLGWVGATVGWGLLLLLPLCWDPHRGALLYGPAGRISVHLGGAGGRTSKRPVAPDQRVAVSLMASNGR